MQSIFDYIDSIPDEYRFFYCLGFEVFIIAMIVAYWFFGWMILHYIREGLRWWISKWKVRGRHSRKSRAP